MVRYRGVAVGTFVPDLVVEECVILELKAVTRLVTAHEVQLVYYLTAAGMDTGLLLNFGAPSRRCGESSARREGGVETGEEQLQLLWTGSTG